MPVNTNAKRVNKIFHGSTQVYSDNTTWTALKLGPNVTGMVVFRDNGNGTGSLAGSVQVQGIASQLVLYPPEGYQFTSVNWSLHYINTQGIGGYQGIGYSGNPSIVNGNLYFADLSSSSTYYSITFQQGMMMSNSTNINGSDPAIIGIKSV